MLNLIYWHGTIKSLACWIMQGANVSLLCNVTYSSYIHVLTFTLFPTLLAKLPTEHSPPSVSRLTTMLLLRLTQLTVPRPFSSSVLNCNAELKAGPFQWRNDFLQLNKDKTKITVFCAKGERLKIVAHLNWNKLTEYIRFAPTQKKG